MLLVSENRSRGREAFYERVRPWHIWLALAAGIVFISLPFTLRVRVSDPDNWMRLLEVRDWLAGQSWWDVRQYRMDAPFGAAMHWTRLVDLPIAAAILLFDLFLPYDAAETAALAAVPLGQLLIAILLIDAIAKELGFSRTIGLVAAAIVPLFPLLVTNFLPYRIDHHGWQGLAALGVALLMLRQGWRNAAIAGFIASAWITISLEGLPLAAVFGGLFALRYALRGVREHEAYLLGLAIGGPAIFAATHLPSDYARPMCDILSWPHFAAFAGAALMALAARLLPGQDTSVGRLASLVPIPTVAVPAILLPLGACALNPISAIDPVLHEKWFMNIKEGISIVHQAPSVMGMLLWTIALTLFAGWTMLRDARDDVQREKRAYYVFATLAAGGISLLAMRAGLTSQLMLVPLSAMLLVSVWPVARGLRGAPSRIVATLALLGLATPAFSSALLRPFDNGKVNVSTLPPKDGRTGNCDYAKLATLPKSRLFTTLDLGPEILVNTQHSVVMGGYHRNEKKMLEVFGTFSGPIDQAEATVRANRSDYVVACTSSADLAVYLTLGSNTLAEGLYYDHPPAWLEPVPAFEGGSLKVWKVRPAT